MRDDWSSPAYPKLEISQHYAKQLVTDRYQEYGSNHHFCYVPTLYILKKGLADVIEDNNNLEEITHVVNI
jgi:hypothetical protein